MKTAFLNVITTSTPGSRALSAAVFFFIWVHSSSWKFFRLDGCLWLFINSISLKHPFVSYDCCSDLKAVWIRGKTLLLFGLKVVTNAKLLRTVSAFEALNFSMGMGILVTFWIASWIKFCGYSCEYETFWSSSKRFF